MNVTGRPDQPRRSMPLAGRIVLASILAISLGRSAEAQGPAERPAYENFRFDEDWSPLRDPALRTGLFDPIKWIPVSRDGSSYLTLGGEWRERYEVNDHPLFGLGSVEENDYLLQRFYLLGDLHLGPHLRSFVQLASGITAGWDGKPPPTQQNQLDVLQAFAELDLPLGSGLTLRGGRQEMSFGSSRLVSVRESPNIRRAFDGIRASWSGPSDLRIDGFLVRPVAPERGSFNDSSDDGQAFWGIYGTAPVPAVSDLGVDLYYLGLERDDAEYAQGTAAEHRHTIGARLFGEQASFDWDLEAAFQFGTFGNADIRAWTVSSDIGYTIMSWPFSPRLGLKADAISGDDDLDDGTLGTFNPLFPKLPYFSEANLAAPANLLAIQPNLTLALTSAVELGLGWNLLWKQADADAFYAPPLTPVENTSGGAGSFLGQQFITSIEWAATEQLTLGGTYVYFTPGDRLEEAGGRSGQFAAMWAKFLF
jgi:hypothetical protein